MSTNAHTILVADDNAWNRDLLTRRLSRAGYEVAAVENGEEALEYVRNSPVDLVLLDVMMPGLSGIEVLRLLRKSHTPAELPIIMATAKNQSEDIVEALDQGANDYVTKPLDFAVILARVQAQLRMKASATATPPKRSANDADSITLIAALKPGMVLGGKYKLEEELGSGSFGVVYRASHLGFREAVAVKLLQASVEDSSAAIERFRREGTSLLHLKHPNAVTVLDFGVTSGGLAYLVMEILTGRNLSQEIHERGRLDPRRVAEIAIPVCEVLEEAHSMSLVHRDIKPGNIFLHHSRRGEIVKVLDFGIAKLVGEERSIDDATDLTVDQTILGTPAYIAPERLCGQSYDGRSDVYSLGIVLYQMLTGRPPFTSKDNQAVAVAMMHITQPPPPLRDLMPEVPEVLERLVLKTLAKEPGARPTAAELGQRLIEVAHGLGATLTASAAPAPLAAEPADFGELEMPTLRTTPVKGTQPPPSELATVRIPAGGALESGSAALNPGREFAFPELLAPSENAEPLPNRPGRSLEERWTSGQD